MGSKGFKKGSKRVQKGSKRFIRVQHVSSKGFTKVQKSSQKLQHIELDQHLHGFRRELSVHGVDWVASPYSQS